MHRSISLVDIALFPESKEIWESKDEERINKLLYDIGFDITKNIEQQHCLHRPLSSKEIVEDLRIVGQERKDAEWMESEYCTRENKLELLGAKDFHLLRDLVTLNKRPNFTAMIISHMQGDAEDINVKFVPGEVEDD